MKRRRFDHLYVEISVAVGQVIPRYALWLRVQELGWDPDRMSREAALCFCDQHLAGFLQEASLCIEARAWRRLRRSLGRFDPRHPTPEETLARMFSPR